MTFDNIDDKLSKVKYKPSQKCHLNPDFEKCKICKDKPCTYVCPANVYSWDEENQNLLVGYENCLECGACRITCEKCCIDWKYPEGGLGVTFKKG